MKAIIVKEAGSVEQLQMSEQPKPIPKKGELLVKVKATAINRTDIIKRRTYAEEKDHPILGVEVAGVVEETVLDSNIQVGSRVMGLVNDGGYAEYAVMPVERAMTIPKSITFTEAAAIPEVFLTAYQTLFWLGNLTERETVLIHAGGSGVGTAAIQLAKELTNANIIVTAGTKEKLDYCKTLGADTCINYKEQAFDEEVMRQTNNKGVDVILDFIGASYFEKNFRSMKQDGRWVLIGVLGGAKVQEVNLMKLMMKRVQLIGTLLTPRSDSYKAALANEFFNKTIKQFETKKLKPIIDRVFAFDEVKEAHEHMEANKNIGKIILKVHD